MSVSRFRTRHLVLNFNVPWPQGLEYASFPSLHGQALRDVVRELVALKPHQPLGRHASALSRRVREWFLRARKLVRGNDKTVTGSLEKCIAHWKEHLNILPAPHRERILSRILRGVPLPWANGKSPRKPIRCFRNSPDLKLRKDDVWRTLKEQLQEGAVLPWDVQGQGLPMGVSPIKWVVKDDPNKVRVVIALCSINDEFEVDAGKCKLDSLDSIRYMWEVDDWQITGDEHSGFYHYKNLVEECTWTAFSLAPDELPDGVADALRKKYPQCFEVSTGRLVFTFAGLPQGATHSVKVFDDLSKGFVAGLCAHKCGSQFARAVTYIDDFLFLLRSPRRT